MNRKQRSPHEQQQPCPGQVVEVTGTDLNRHGHGLARWNGWVLIVPDLLPGERAQVQIQQKWRSQWLARNVQTLQTVPGRRDPPCSQAKDCGGCSLQHLGDDDQVSLKQSQLTETFKRLAKIKHPLKPLLASTERSLGYRNRALIPLRRHENGELQMGYYKRGSHKIVDIDKCPVLDQRLEKYLLPLKNDIEANQWPADSDLISGDGLRHLGLRIGQNTGQVLITLVSSVHKLEGLIQQAQTWCNRWPEVVGVTINIQPAKNNLVLGDKTRLLAGQQEIEEYFCGLRLMLSTTTFFQVNTIQAQKIVTMLCQWLSRNNAVNVIDAYCGIGTISLPLVAAGASVVGLEIHENSIQQAKRNASINNLLNSNFISGDVGANLESQLPHCDALIVDPPRKGLNQNVIENILNNPPRLVGYLSCDPTTLARDLNYLLSPGGVYEIEELQPIDFFPQTTHVECLALLRRVNS